MRRGQAALEFLTTYGWAFMVILVAIGALSYLGVTNPDRFIPERCVSSQGISCVDSQLTTDQLSLFISNDLGQSIVLDMSAFEVIQVSSGDEIHSGDCEIDSDTLSATSREEITCDLMSDSVVQGSKERLEVRGTYRRTAGQYDQPITIEVVATVQ